MNGRSVIPDSERPPERSTQMGSQMSTSSATSRQIGYVLILGAVVVLAGGVLYTALQGGPPLSYLGPVIPAGILFVVGYRTVRADRRDTVVTDERRKMLLARAGNVAFWLFINAIVLDVFLQLTPEEGLRTVYVAIGLGSFVVGLLLVTFAPG